MRRAAPAVPVLVFVLAAAAALAGCGRNAAPSPCPGTLQGRFLLTATLLEGADCAAAASAAPGGTLEVSFTGDAAAAVCTGRALAEPLAGTRSGDAIDVTAANAPASLAGCACALRVTERLTATLARDGAGDAVSFAGELVDDVAPETGTTCAAATGAAACAAPCRARWAIRGTR